MSTVMYARPLRAIRAPTLNTARRMSATSGDALPGTVAYHNAYLFLHTRQPPSVHPKRVPSRLQRALQREIGRWNGIVNFSWSPEQKVLGTPFTETEAEWEEENEAYHATLFSKSGGRAELPLVSMQNLDEVMKQLGEHVSNTSALDVSNRPAEPLHLYVCTHGARDCRCGNTGGALYAALRAEVQKRSLSDTVKVASVGHVGGHKCVFRISSTRD